MRLSDLTGQRFGRLLVLEQAETLSPGNARWKCQCDCGSVTYSQGGTLRTGRHLSCGCLQRERATKHGMERSVEYMTWAQMKSRCINPNHRSYGAYGGRGITVCKRWLSSFEKFFADMGNRPEGHSLERINNEKGYSPSNCRWASTKDQNNNRRNNVRLVMDGKSQTLTEWADKYDISPITVKSRLKAGWPVADALLRPVDKRKATKSKK